MKLFHWEKLLDTDGLFDEPPEYNLTGWDLATDVYKKDGSVMVEMQLPGIDPDTYNISLEDNTLNVKGERKEKKEVEDENYFRREIHRGGFERTVMLPEGNYDKQSITTDTENGVLKISIQESRS